MFMYKVEIFYCNQKCWNKTIPTFIFFGLKRLKFHYISLHILRGFLPNFPEATFIQRAISISDSSIALKIHVEKNRKKGTGMCHMMFSNNH